MQKVELQNLRLDRRYESLKEISGKEFIKIKEFIDKNKNGENNSNRDITDKTERKYIDALVMAYHSTKKPLLQLNKEDLIKLKSDLKEGRIKSRFNKPYSLTSQRNMEFILINFLDWAKPEKYSGFKKWFIVRAEKKDVDYLKEEEIKILYKSCKNNYERFLIAVLFDSGARASEFLNIRAEDITEPTTSFPYYKINFKEEYSKTKGRNVGLYWKYSTEAIKDFIRERGELKPKEVVFDKTYDSIRIFLTRMGKKILNKRIHFHIFRKSSASYYAVKLKSRQQLCYRYGWNFSSDVPDVYITRNQGEEEVKENILNTSLEELSKKMNEEKTKYNIVIEEQRKEFDLIKGGFSKQDEVIKLLLEANNLRNLAGIPKKQQQEILNKMNRARELVATR
ncbi:site-specific integrase [Candidatus Pacearchaeota archaeon]|nr:site-specific integrase [Candidatus Pacearchaeota archaeon]